MKYLHLIIIFLFLLPLKITGQVFHFEKIDYRDTGLEEYFSNYEVYRIPYKSIHQFIGDRADDSRITFTINGKSQHWNIYENNMLDPGFKLITQKEGKEVEVDFDKTCRTYRGIQNDNSNQARFTITSRNFFALIPDPQGNIYIQPLKNFTDKAPGDLFVSYRQQDLISDGLQKCPVSGKSHYTPADQNPDENIGGRNQPRSYSCLELEVTMATDWRIAQELGSEEDLLDYNVTVLNHVEHHFLSDFDLDFWVRQYYYVGPFEDNPWGDALEVDDLLSDFGDWAYTYFTTEDIGHLWTSGNLHDDDDNGTIGYASVGGACDDIGLYPWGLLERFTPTISTLALLQAHEYGHLLDADHEEGSGTIMEPSIGDIECSCWDPDNIVEMWDFIEDETCIETCVQCPFSYNIIDRIAWGDWKYSSILSTSSKAYIYHEADIVLQSEGYVKLLPGFFATSLDEASGGATLVARVATCE